MRKHTRHIIICTIAFFLLNAIFTTLHASNNKYEQFFLPIDSAIANHAEYEFMLELQIIDLKNQLNRVSIVSDVYLINNLLATKYSNYICDSALVYLDANEQIALKENRIEWLYDVYLDRCYIYIQTGMLNEAIREFDKINIEKMPDSLKATYYVLKVYFLEQETIFTGTNRKDHSEYGALITKYAVTSEDRIWGLIWTNPRGGSNNTEILDLLKREYEKNISTNTLRAGNNALLISKYVSEDEEENIKYICLAALSDVKHVNRDPTALLELVSYLSSVGDSQRAFTYLDYVLQGQSFYPARVSGAQMAQYMKRIFEETQLRSEQEQHNTEVYMRWLWIAIVALIILVIIVSLITQKLIKQRRNITEINDQLNINLVALSATKEELVKSNRKMKKIADEVSDANQKLKESNYLKEEYIGHIFSACSNYLTKMDEFRQNINRKMKTGKTDEVLRMTMPTSTFLNNEIKELNHTFDSIFLSIYPDFVADFNSLLHKEEHIVLQTNEDLNTELRIYALIWLGINSSSKIASLLHVSAQTVYNARMKMRNKAIMDGEKFAEAVQALGR